jgi:hypothetical protein
MLDVLFSIMPDPVIFHMLASEIMGGNDQPHFAAQEPGGWHRDSDSRYFANDPTHVSIFVYLSDVGVGDGAFEISPRPPQTPLQSESPVVSVTGRRGTSFVWHRSFFHRASPNRGPRRRRIIKFSIQRKAFGTAHLSNYFFRDTLARVEPGQIRVDMLLGRFLGMPDPSIPPSTIVAPSRATPTSIIGDLAIKIAQESPGAPDTAKAPYAPRDASDLSPLSHILAHDGVAMLPDIYSINDLAELNAAMDPFFKARPPGPKTYLWADDMLELNIVDKVLCPAMKDTLFSLLPDPVIYHLLVSEIASNGRLPPVNANGGWLRDEDCRYIENDPTHLSLVVYLSNTGESDGMFQFSPQDPRTPLHSDSPVISMAGSAGLSFVWNRGFRYREALNTGHGRRRIIKISIQRNHFISSGLRQPFFRRALNDTPRGATHIDVLLGRFENKKPPRLAPTSVVSGRRLPAMSTIRQTLDITQ